ncbi:zinc-binding dehydrogenase [Streptomyces sp. ISL-111]|uniref:zinc-binding dehydrogenase n=1 Tax=Streptomyces sp. ISL-111 TaxID=2819175 RepID=UPI001BE6F98F|nr:zinc-binding dehydrogenase [Streptomyces sp. ISL-111]MBT2375815.1 zinc-binding dehydrogenase [Streptomyces sp. ISL-111]
MSRSTALATAGGGSATAHSDPSIVSHASGRRGVAVPARQKRSNLGAARVIDYTRTELTGTADRFDVLDVVGNLSIAAGRRLLSPGGVLLLAVADLGDTVPARGNVFAGPAPERVADFEFLLRLAAEGSISVVIDQVYDLRDITAAHHRVDSGRKIGNIVVRP